MQTRKEIRKISQIIRSILDLYLLPEDDISSCFRITVSFKYRLRTSRAIYNLLTKNWLKSNVWIPTGWYFFNIFIRTNSDVEGWHLRLNHLAQSRRGVNFYELIQFFI